MPIRNTPERLFAEFQHLYIGDFRQDIPIYLDLVAKHEGSVLDVGCGSGRVAAALAAAGHIVHAIDISTPTLELAVEHLRPWSDRVRVSYCDLRHQTLSERYSTAILPLFTFNELIDVEEQRLFLRHLRRSLKSPGVTAIDLFCPRSMLAADRGEDWREIRRSYGSQELRVRDRRQMLTPLLERRTQIFSVNGGPETEIVKHRRFVPPFLASQLLTEAGFENVRCIEGYDLATLRPVQNGGEVHGPFMMIADV